ncbi:MAG: hypothetical protein FWG48_04455 [Oscillospiraceae bacterium]|nr:hypothetical protein [Oscillospiraceae bacterium]
MTFTVGPRDQEDFEVDVEIDPTVVSVGTALLLLVVAASISAAFVRANVRKEPLLLLSSKNE